MILNSDSDSDRDRLGDFINYNIHGINQILFEILMQ